MILNALDMTQFFGESKNRTALQPIEPQLSDAVTATILMLLLATSQIIGDGLILVRPWL